jgi:hypothetical protein
MKQTIAVRLENPDCRLCAVTLLGVYSPLLLLVAAALSIV